jgi:hypothetical protein
MTRVLVLGNSHLAAFKAGWEEHEELTGELDATFIGARANWFNALELDGTVLKVESPQIRELAQSSDREAGDIDIEDWDAFVLVGMYLRPRFLMQMYLTHRLPQHHEPGKQVISEAAFEAAVAEGMRDASGYRTAVMLREVSQAPICVVTEPFPSIKITRHPAAASRYGMDSPHMEFLYDAYRRHLDGLFEDLDVDVITQPRKTIARGGMFTRPRFGKGSLQGFRGDQHRTIEFFHMNPEYGALTVQECAPRLRARLGAAAAS